MEAAADLEAVLVEVTEAVADLVGAAEVAEAMEAEAAATEAAAVSEEV